jgi:hypothetical protein
MSSGMTDIYICMHVYIQNHTDPCTPTRTIRQKDTQCWDQKLMVEEQTNQMSDFW